MISKRPKTRKSADRADERSIVTCSVPVLLARVSVHSAEPIFSISRAQAGPLMRFPK